MPERTQPPATIAEAAAVHLTDREVQGVYSRLSPLYGFWERWAEGHARKLALELAGITNGERVLEVAVGPGTLLEELARRNPAGRTVGVDLTQSMLERTRRRFRRQEMASPALCQCDARSLPFAPASFDLVVSGYLLDLLTPSDIERTLQQMRRVLRPSGRLVLFHLSLGNLWFDRLWRLLSWLVPTLLGGCRPIRLAGRLPAVGFAVLESHRVVQRGVPTEGILAVVRH